MDTTQEKEIQELVIARLRTLPDGKEVSIGSTGEFTRDQLIEHVKAGDEVGRQITDIEMHFLRALKDGVFYEDDYLAGDAA